MTNAQSIDYGDVASVAAATRAKVAAWRSAYIAMRKAGIARGAVWPEASRARLTTANARAQRAAEDFDRKDADLREWGATIDPVDVDALKDREDRALMIGLRP